MPNVESYIEGVSLIDVQQLTTSLDNDIQASLESIAELVLNIFDTSALSIVANRPQRIIELYKFGSKITVAKEQLSNDIFSESIIESNPKIFRVISPIILPSGLKFGWFIFDRASDSLLTEKEQSILNSLQKNFVNQLIQRKKQLEKINSSKFHSTIFEQNKEDEIEKDRLLKKLQKVSDELDEFTSIASHDLKSPLNAIKRLLEWIYDDCKDLLPQEHLENFQLVLSRANRMQVLLEDLLSYSRINSCDSTRANISLESIYQDVEQILEVPQTVTVDIHANNEVLDIPLIPFKTVFQNLISNAIKHNNKEHPVIDISLIRSNQYYIIEIKDNGPGIDPKYFSLIFKLFQTLQSRDDVEGSGIGLCIANKLIINYSGKIEVASDGKLGSTFTIYWPKF
ncbi:MULTISPECIES: sensor histidine kinase [Pseudoalteromonas]|uniref:sensor histidine kinase n=1 Tax=Pseudoalteromonas TaxID=53246 RepID=UPI000C331A3C|nr:MULTISPECIES: ATP-binding protein [Pseudoalteromonas]PKG68490.1 two-component sensor histidine kinase [Pseudoalteromonas arctica]PKG70869.1 two-component sensor histidine kinase [Pseudoalteromonas sp. GutCa3]